MSSLDSASSFLTLFSTRFLTVVLAFTIHCSCSHLQSLIVHNLPAACGVHSLYYTNTNLYALSKPTVAYRASNGPLIAPPAISLTTGTTTFAATSYCYTFVSNAIIASQVRGIGRPIAHSLQTSKHDDPQCAPAPQTTYPSSCHPRYHACQ